MQYGRKEDTRSTAAARKAYGSYSIICLSQVMIGNGGAMHLSNAEQVLSRALNAPSRKIPLRQAT